MVWDKPASGAWASAVEEEEQEHGTIKAPVVEEQEFPSLGLAATVKETKKEKKKKQTLSLSEFMGGGISSSRSIANDDRMSLPTAPRQRAEGEEESERGLGGGFRGYGGDRFSGGGGGGRFGDGERRPRQERNEEDEGPSRADAVDNWGAERKFVPTSDSDRYGGGGGGFRDRETHTGGGFKERRDFEDEGPSRADTAGDWGSTRQFVPGSPRRPRDSFREPSRADVEERWERSQDHKPVGFEERPRRAFDDEPRGGGGGGRRGFADSWRGRDSEGASGGSGSRDGSQDRWRKDVPAEAEAEDNDNKDAPRERPKLNLKPRTTSPAASAVAVDSSASRPSLFGAARPREEVLRDQGRDAIEEDEKLARKPESKGRRELRERKPSPEEEALVAKIEEAKAAVEVAEDKGAAQEVVDALDVELSQMKLEAKASRGRGEGERANGRAARDGDRPGSRREGAGGFARRTDAKDLGGQGRW